MQVNILQTRCMVLECIVLQMVIDMKDRGMKEKDKDLECTLSEMERHNLDTGKMGCLMSQVHRVRCILYHLLPFIIPKCLTQFRYFLICSQKKLEVAKREGLAAWVTDLNL